MKEGKEKERAQKKKKKWDKNKNKLQSYWNKQSKKMQFSI